MASSSVGMEISRTSGDDGQDSGDDNDRFRASNAEFRRTKGPEKESTRASVVHSVFLYGVPVWASAVHWMPAR